MGRVRLSRDPERVGAAFTADAEWLAPADNATARAIGGTHHTIERARIVELLTSESGTVFVADVSVDFRGVFADGDTVVRGDPAEGERSAPSH